MVGISGVGTIVLVSTAALVLGWPRVFLPTAQESFGNEVATLLAVLLFHAAVLAPFDVVGGHVIPVGFGRSDVPPHRFALIWLRGVAVQLAMFLACGLSLLTAGRAGGLPAAIAVFAGWMVALMLLQGFLARTLGGLRVVKAPLDDLRGELSRRGVAVPQATVLAGRDIGFTGGVVGAPGRERLLVPSHWRRGLGDEGLKAELLRWASVVRSGSRWRGIAAAFAWNLGGFVLASFLPGADVVSVAGLVTIVLGFTLWSFIGLLVLPSLSRPAVLAADRRALEAGADAAALEQTIERLDRLQDDEPDRTGVVETIFHPLPARARRIARMKADDGVASMGGAWHAARMALFLSWAGLGLLSRAVHCNSGRPELWALLPCD